MWKCKGVLSYREQLAVHKTPLICCRSGNWGRLVFLDILETGPKLEWLIRLVIKNRLIAVLGWWLLRALLLPHLQPLTSSPIPTLGSGPLLLLFGLPTPIASKFVCYNPILSQCYHGPICNENLTMFLPCLKPPSAPFPRKEPRNRSTEPCLPRQCHLLPAHCPADEQDISYWCQAVSVTLFLLSSVLQCHLSASLGQLQCVSENSAQEMVPRLGALSPP